MRRLAIFVEGYTEALFVRELVEHVAGSNRVTIDCRRISGGTTVPKKIMQILTLQRVGADGRYYILIYDCGGDHQVKSRILEEHEHLTKQGYSKIIGMLGVRPRFRYDEIPLLERGLRTRVPTALTPVEFVLSVMEVEAWFLAEFSHFLRIDPGITLAAIGAAFGFNPETDDMSDRAHPSNDLNNCYGLAGRAYRKSDAADTIHALDFDEFYLNTSQRIPYALRLIRNIEEFLHVE